MALINITLLVLFHCFRTVAISPIGERLAGLLLLAIFVWTLAYSVIVFNTTANNDVDLILDKFILPIIMTVASIPYLYLLGLYCTYEDLFNMMRATNPSGTKLSVYRWALISICGFSNARVRKFRKRVLYIRPDDKNFKEARKVLKSVENVDYTTGEY